MLKEKIEYLINDFKDDTSAVAKTIVMFLVVVLIFTGIYGTIAYNLELLQENASVIAIPGGVVMVGIVGLLGIIILVMYAVKKAF